MDHKTQNVGKRTAWTPNNITTVAWYDPSDASTVSETAGAVSQLNDKSGNGYHLTQGTVAKQPIVGARTINDLDVLDFDGSDDALYNASSVLAGDPNVMLIGVFLYEGGTQEYAIHIGTSDPLGGIAIDFNDGGGRYVARLQTATETYGTSTKSQAVITALTNPSGADVDASQMFENGSELSSLSSLNGTATKNLQDSITLGAYLNGSAAEFNGAIGEVLILTDMTTNTRQRIEGYLAWKYGLVDNLPYTHPYKYNGEAFGYVTPWSPKKLLKRWTPEFLTTKAWYDATDASTITEAGGVVSQWDDKSGNACHLTQGTASLQPTTGGATFNGNNVLSSDQDYMSAAIPAGTFPTSLQVTGVIKKTGANTTYEAFFGRTVAGKPSPTDRYLDRIFVGNASTFLSVLGMTDIRDLTTPTLISTLANSTNVKEWVAGINITDEVHGTTYGDTATTFELGSRADGVTRFRGDWGEIVLSTELSESDRQRLEGYLAHKWGLTASLDGGHPYKTEPPMAGALVSWYDPADPSTITEVTGVSQLDDKSGNDYHLTQAVGSQQPLTGLNTINDLNVLNYSTGSAQALVNTSFTKFAGINNSIGIYAVAKTSGTSTQKNIVCVTSTTDTNSSHLIYEQGFTRATGLFRRDDVATVKGAAGTPAFQVNIPVIVSSIFDGSVMSAYSDGNQVFAGIDGTLGQQSFNQLQISGCLSSFYYDGDIGEVIITDGTETEADRLKIEGYLANKWGIA